MPTKSSSEKYFGLRRNMQGITYIKTINTQFGNFPHFVYNPFPAYELLELAKNKLDASDLAIVKPILDIIIEVCGAFQEMKVYEKSEYSWYIADKNFHKQKIKVSMTNEGFLGKNKNNPLFTDLLGIKYPIMTVFSAASIYNTKGAMFPRQESSFTGFPTRDLKILLDIAYGTISGRLIAQCTKIHKLFGGLVSIHLVATYAARNIQGLIGEGNSPIKNYEKAKDGGWAAHLVPYEPEEQE
jgi:hypothetical protein